MQLQVEGSRSQFLCSKTRVVSDHNRDSVSIHVGKTLLFGTSRATLTRKSNIFGSPEESEWKQFVQNRVNEIHELVSLGDTVQEQRILQTSHPGVSPRELQEKLDLWLHGIPTLQYMEEDGEVMTVPEDCLVEMKTRDKGP